MKYSARCSVRLAVASALITASLAAFATEPSTKIAVVGPRTDQHTGMPSDAELQTRGARIGRIEVQVDDIFETQPARSLASPYRLANALHISTQEETIRQQLLFGSGEPFQRRLLDETERLLRGQHYLNDATVTSTRYHEDNTVDVLVRVHDVWTLSPGFSFGRKGGENRTRLEFEDSNFLGLGKQVSLERSSDVDRTAWRLAYVDPNLFGTRWTLSTAYSSMSDGSEKLLALSRPFYSLDSRWSANVEAADLTSSISRYSLGKRVERFNMQERELDIGGGLSEGLSNGWVTRYLAGFRYDERAFATRTDEPNALLPAGRTLSYPWVGVEILEDNYRTTRNLDQIGRTEDLYLGRSVRLEAGFASPALGSTRDAFILNGALTAGAALGNERFLINTIGTRGRIEGGALVDAVLEAGSRFYLRQSQRRVFFASANATVTSNLDPEKQLLLGGDNGLRGYPLRYQAGSANALISLEQRFYTSWQPLKLFNVGAAVFFDAGRSWGRDEYAAPPAGWLKDVGIGLRLGSARSGLGSVLHIDLAMPLDRTRDIDSMQLLIESRKSF
ncbi:BamA/TamA family outer membrane protein [Steroidobacter sp.]|uniref:BamA/TamA family outer membrane protein n=1 Tax=Steroidobacter sp. TaxID=1978227 RepID=UPI001A4CAFC9|nr:BamA/TamA family outer membrane protein [Steroidobacter sp.]MBL8268534.1 BamA/TamA family outer membrane protein [Steroidobacter sp.]